MGATKSILATPNNRDIGLWFNELAERLLNHSALLVAGSAHHIVELELYYRSAQHPDPFVHDDARQESLGRWYFHRRAGQYTGGSYKGLDLTFGAEGISAGALIRTLKTPQGQLIHGCSLCVDYLLTKTGFGHVRELDEALGEGHIWDESEFLQLVATSPPRVHHIYSSARVCLTLKRAGVETLMPDYIMRPYRFFTEPSLNKGKLHTIIALYKKGVDLAAIRELTHSTQVTIERYIKAFEVGQARGQMTRYVGRALKPAELCELHGVWHRCFEQEASWST